MDHKQIARSATRALHNATIAARTARPRRRVAILPALLSLSLVSLIILLAAPAPVFARSSNKAPAYHITNYHVDMVVHANNSYSITETIDADFTEPAHGIFRDIPTQTYNGIPVDITNIQCDQPFTHRIKGGDLRLIIGDRDKEVQGPVRYTISYLYDIGNDGLTDMDELYFNIIGNGWKTTIDKVSFSIHLPAPVSDRSLNFTYGPKGSTAKAPLDLQFSPTLIEGQLKTSLQPGEALTIALPLPEGYFDAPMRNAVDPLRRFKEFIPFGVLILAIILFVIYIVYNSSRRKKLHQAAEGLAQTTPPAGLTPADLYYVTRWRVGSHSVVALLLYWAQLGYLRLDPVRDVTADGRSVTEDLIITILTDPTQNGGQMGGQQPYGQPGSQPFGQPGPQPYGQPGSQPFGQPGPQSYGQPAPQQRFGTQLPMHVALQPGSPFYDAVASHYTEPGSWISIAKGLGPDPASGHPAASADHPPMKPYEVEFFRFLMSKATPVGTIRVSDLDHGLKQAFKRCKTKIEAFWKAPKRTPFSGSGIFLKVIIHILGLLAPLVPYLFTGAGGDAPIPSHFVIIGILASILTWATSINLCRAIADSLSPLSVPVMKILNWIFAYPFFLVLYGMFINKSEYTVTLMSTIAASLGGFVFHLLGASLVFYNKHGWEMTTALTAYLARLDQFKEGDDQWVATNIGLFYDDLPYLYAFDKLSEWGRHNIPEALRTGLPPRDQDPFLSADLSIVLDLNVLGRFVGVALDDMSKTMDPSGRSGSGGSGGSSGGGSSGGGSGGGGGGSW